MEEDTEMALPDDALAGVLARLPPRALAACRCVSRSWRALVDARGLLVPHVLPRALRGIFINYIDYPRPGLFFARPHHGGGTSTVNAHLPVGASSDVSVLDHCNGLLLYGGCGSGASRERELYVANPATRRWERLPPPLLPAVDDASTEPYLPYLAFDPAASPHYEVVSVPRVPEKPTTRPSSSGWDWKEDELLDPYRTREWPPPSCTMQVFSSATNRWERRRFGREGEAVGTVEDARTDSFPWMYLGPRRRYAAYWRGALYVHCQGAFVVRISTRNATYQVIATPIGVEEGKSGRSYLGRSEKGVYFAAFCDYYLLRVWVLDESSRDCPKWVLTHDIDLESSAVWAALHLNNSSNRAQRIDGPCWILLDDDSAGDSSNDDSGDADSEEVPNRCLEEEWDSDGDNAVDYEEKDEYEHAYIYLLGFHPYKEVVFLMASYVGVAYHLNSSKVQYLGKLYPKDYDLSSVRGVHESFPYTRCLVGQLSFP